MTLVLLVVIILAGAIALYALARRFTIAQNGAAMLAGIGALTAILVAAIPRETAVQTVVSDAPMVAPVAAPSSSPVLAAVPEVIPSPTSLSLDDVRRMSAASGHVPGSIDNIALAPTDGGTVVMAAHRIAVKKGTVITLSGWAADLPAKSLDRGIIALVDGKVAASGPYGVDRGDVAKYYQLASIRFCGYSVRLPALSPGHHRIDVAAVNLKRNSYAVLIPPFDVVVQG